MSRVIENFINPESIDLTKIDFKPIVSGRRVAHYGYEYCYFSKTLKSCKPIPPELDFSERISDIIGRPIKFNQLIVNEYKKGQGISPHIDNMDLFGPVIACISIGANGRIKFGNGKIIEAKIGSLYLMEGEYRTKHTHQYKNGSKKTRYSFTYRTVDE